MYEYFHFQLFLNTEMAKLIEICLRRSDWLVYPVFWVKTLLVSLSRPFKSIIFHFKFYSIFLCYFILTTNSYLYHPYVHIDKLYVFNHISVCQDQHLVGHLV